LGNDLFGRNFIGILARDDICTEGISFTDKVPTSVASILVDNDGIPFLKHILIDYQRNFRN